jgi:hypothetical protein
VKTTLLRAGAALSLVLMVAACSGGGGSDGGTTDNKTQDVLLQYAQCMRDNGVNLPDPVAGDPGSLYQGVDKSSASFVAANKVCGHFLEGVVQERDNQDQQDQQQQDDQLLQLAQCLRQHGINVKDPVPGQGFGTDLDRTDPTVAKVLQSCQQQGSTPSSS